MNQSILQQIDFHLDQIETTHNVRILHACESGSRAWGFASTDSDWDVRFIYVHPRDFYLSIESHRDVIENPISDDLDISGWDLRKALGLLLKSNPPLLEWISSPIVYRQDPDFLRNFRRLSEDFYSPQRCFRHYLHMAEGNHRHYLLGETIALKKYFYVLRPVLACLWIERQLGPVPMEFSKLVEQIVDDSDVKNAIARLLERKMSGEELDRSPRIEVLSQFIEQALPRLDLLFREKENNLSVDPLNRLFRQYLNP